MLKFQTSLKGPVHNTSLVQTPGQGAMFPGLSVTGAAQTSALDCKRKEKQ